MNFIVVPKFKITYCTFKILKVLTIKVLFLLNVLLGKFSKKLYEMFRILGKIIAPHAKNTVHLIGNIEYSFHNLKISTGGPCIS